MKGDKKEKIRRKKKRKFQKKIYSVKGKSVLCTHLFRFETYYKAMGVNGSLMAAGTEVKLNFWNLIIIIYAQME